MDYLRNLNSQNDFSNADLSNALHSLQTKSLYDPSNPSHHESKTKIISDLFQIASIPQTQIKMPLSRWNEVKFNIYLFVASIYPNPKIIPNLCLDTNSGPLFFISTLLHPFNLLYIYKQVHIKTDDSGPSMLIHQNYYSHEQIASALIEIFKKISKLIIECQTNSMQFYTSSILSFSQTIPLILANEAPGFLKDPKFLECFRFVKNNLPQINMKATNYNNKIILTYQMQTFLYDLIRQCRMSNITELCNEAFDSMTSSITEDISISSILIPFYFQYYYSKVLLTSYGEDKSQYTDIFYQNSLFRVNDIFKLFQYYSIYECFNRIYQEIDKTAKKQPDICSYGIVDITYFITQMMNSSQEVMNFRRTPQSRAHELEFRKSLLNLYIKYDSKWPLLFILEKVNSTINFYTKKLNVIKAIVIRDANDKNLNIEKTISFEDQMTETDLYIQSNQKERKINSPPNIQVQFTNNSNENKESENEKYKHIYSKKCYMKKINESIDQLLFSAFEYRTYSTYEEALKAYEALVETFNISKRGYIPISLFGFQIFQNIFFYPLENVNQRSLFIYYAERFLKSFFNFIIFSSYHFMLLNNFSKIKHQYKNNQQRLQLPKPNEYIFAYSKNLGELFNQPSFKSQYLILAINVLTDCLFSGMKKQVISYPCIKCIHIIIKNNHLNHLIQKMTEVAYSNYFLLNSYDNSKVILFQQWIFLIIKIGGRSFIYPSSSEISKIFRNFQHAFVSYFFNKSNLMNQPETILTICNYINAMKSNLNDPNKLKQLKNPEKESKNLLKAQKYIMLNDFRLDYYPEVSNLYMDRTIFDINENSLIFYPNIYSLIFYVLNSGNLENIKFGLYILSRIIIRTEYYIDCDNDTNAYTLKDLLYSIKNLPKDLATQLIEIIPQITPLFSSYLPVVNLIHQNYFINIDPTIKDYYKPTTEIDESQQIIKSSNLNSVEYFLILNSIFKNSSRTETEAKHLLILILILVESKEILKFSYIDLEKTFYTLFSIARFENLRNQVDLVFHKMNKLFEPIIKNENFDYVYAFAFSFAISSSEYSNYAINKFKSFMYNLNMRNFDAINIAEKIFTRIKLPDDVYNTLLLFTLLASIKPGSIRINNFILFFSLIKDQNNFMSISKEFPLFSKLFKKFLDKFIQSLNNKEKVSFFNYCLSVVKNRSSAYLHIKMILINKMPLLNLSIESYDPNFYKAQGMSDEVFYLRLSIIISCGSKIQLTQDLVKYAISKLTPSDKQQQQQQSFIMVRLRFILSLTKAKINISLFVDGDKLADILSFLLKIPPSNYIKKITKCINWINQNNPELVKQVIKKNFLIENMATLLKEEKRSRLFLNIYLPLFHQYIDSSHLKITFNLITEFAMQRQLSSINKIATLIKHLNSINFNNPELRAVVLNLTQPNSQITFLGQFINDISKLLSYQDFPADDFLKGKTIQLLLNFKPETIRFIFANSHVAEAKFYYDILYNMIITDKTNEMLNYFIHSIHPLDPYQMEFTTLMTQHPYNFEIESKLSDELEYAKNESFRDLVINQFNKFFLNRNAKYITDNDFNQLNLIIHCFINILKVQPDYTHLINLSSFFAFGTNVYSSLYLKFKHDIFRNKDFIQFYINLLKNVLNDCTTCTIDDSTNEINIISVSLLQIDMEKLKHRTKYFHFMTDSATTIILSNLIKGIGRFPIEAEEKLFDHLLLMLKLMLQNNSYIYCAMKCLYSLIKVNPVLIESDIFIKSDNFISLLQKAIFSFQILLQQPEPYPIILTFKFAVKLLSRNKLPDFVLKDILLHIFTFPKFIDPPYNQIVSLLFKKANSFYSKPENPIPDELMDLFKTFLIEKIILFKDFDKLLCIFKCFPLLIKSLPFSIVPSLIHNIKTRDYSKPSPQAPTNLSHQFQNVNILIKLTSVLDVPDEFEGLFYSTAFDFITYFLAISESDNNHTFLDQQTQNFYSLVSLIMKHGQIMTETSLVAATKRIHHSCLSLAKFCQIICILATEFVDEQLLLTYSKDIIDSFESLINEGNIKSILEYVKTYIKSIFERPKISKLYTNCFFKLIKKYYTAESDKLNLIYDTVYNLLYIYTKETKDVKKDKYLSEFWNIVDASTVQMPKLWIYSFVDLISNLPYEQQSNFLNFIIKKIKIKKIKFPFNLSVLKSTNVSSSLKIEFLRQIMKILPDASYEDTNNLLRIINELEFDTFKYKLVIYIHLIIKSIDESRLFWIDEVSNMLGNSEEERFIKFIRVIIRSNNSEDRFDKQSIKLFNNYNLIFVIFIIMDQTKIIKPLIMLSDCFNSISSNFAIPLFSRILNPNTLSTFYDLLTFVLSLNKSDLYSELISSITTVFSINSINISSKLLYKSIKLTDENNLFYSNNNLTINSSNIIPDKLLYPHKLNDEIFSILPDDLPVEALSASCQFFLSNYDESNKIFTNYQNTIFSNYDASTISSPNAFYEDSGMNLSISSLDTNPVNILLKRMMDISNDFVSKEGTFHVFEGMDRDYSFIQNLENAFNSLSTSLDNAKNDISKVMNYLILFLKDHKHHSFYEIQRVIGIELILSIMNSKISFIATSRNSTVSPQISPTATPMFNQQIKNAPPHTQITPSPTPPLPIPASAVQNKKEFSLISFKIPTMFIKSVLLPIHQSFVMDFERYFFYNDRGIIKSKDNQQLHSKLNLNANPNLSINRTVDLNDSIAIFSHEFRFLFDSVINENSYGFFSVAMSQVDKATKFLLTSLNAEKFKQANVKENNFFNSSLPISNTPFANMYKKESAEQIWPSFCFSMLSMSPTLTPVLHQAALQGYFNLICKRSIALFIQESYAARIITLLSLSVVSMDDVLMSNSLKILEKIVKDNNISTYIKFWGPQVLFLNSNPQFQPHISELFKTYSSLYQTMWAHSIRNHRSEQYDFIALFVPLFKFIFEMSTALFDFNEDEDEEKITDFINNRININKCNDRCNTYMNILADLDSDTKSKIEKLLSMLNQHFPIDFELSNSSSNSIRMRSNKIKIFHINNDFVKVSDNIIAFTGITSFSAKQLFFVEKVHSTDRVITISNTLFLFKQMIKYGYNSRLRNIKLSVNLPFEVGEDMVMYIVPNGSIPVTRFRFTNSSKEGQDNGELKRREFPSFFIKQLLIDSSSYSANTFIEMRKHLVANFAAYSAMRSIFSLEQPSLDQLFISFQTSEVPIIFSHFSIPKNYARTATLIPKPLIDFFNDRSVVSNDNSTEAQSASPNKFDRYFQLAFASVHQTLASYIDNFRSIVEMPIQESIQSANRQLDNILASRDIVEASLFDYVPPFSDGANAPDSVEWFKRMSEYVSNSKGQFNRTVVDNPRAVSIPTANTTMIPTSSRDSFATSGTTNGFGLDLDSPFDMSGMELSDSLRPNNRTDNFGQTAQLSQNTPFESSEVSRNSSFVNLGTVHEQQSGGISFYGSGNIEFPQNTQQTMYGQQQQMINMQMMNQQQNQQNFMGSRMNSFDSGFNNFSNPQPAPKVVSPQIITTPRITPQPSLTQPPPTPPPPPQNDLGNDEPDDDPFSLLFG